MARDRTCDTERYWTAFAERGIPTSANMFSSTCFLFLMGLVLGDDRSCHAEQLNLLQLRNGRGADVLGLEPDSHDVDASEKMSRPGFFFV